MAPPIAVLLCALVATALVGCACAVPATDGADRYLDAFVAVGCKQCRSNFTIGGISIDGTSPNATTLVRSARTGDYENEMLLDGGKRAPP